MIDTKNLVPEVYYKRSRDFQLLGRVYDLVFNYLKTNIDIIYNVPYNENIDDKLVSLVASTLGFKEIHEYNTQQLKALCSVFSQLLKFKGTKKSIQDLLNLVLNVENSGDLHTQDVQIDSEKHLALLYVPLDVKDISLLEDVLTYILPAGMSYRIVKELVIPANNLSTQIVLGNSKADITIKHGSSFMSAQVTQPNETNSTIEKSTDTGYGRIEDMVIADPNKFENNLEEEQKAEVATEIYPEEGE